MVGMSGKEIYDNFVNGVGADRLSGAAEIANEVASKYGERAARVQQLIGKMDAAWQGDAAGAAMRGFGPVGVEHELAGQALAMAQDLTNRQAGSFGDARNAVVPVPPEPVAPDPWAVFTSPGEVKSYYQQVAEYNAANQHNVDVMTGYTDASVYNANGLPRTYGALSPDQAGMVIDPGTSDTGGGPDSGGSHGGSPIERSSGGESVGRDSGWDAPPSDAGPPAGSTGGPPLGGGGGGSVPQQTAPGGFTPPVPGGPATRVPVDAGGVGSGPSPGGPAGGFAPGTGFVPVGGAPTGGPGGRAVGGPGGRAGYGEPQAPGGRAGGGEPHSPGGRAGAGPVSGGVPGESHGGARGGAGGATGRGGAMGGGMPLAGGGRGRDEEDLERRAPDYLQEDDPEGLFGTDVLTAPPVIGEDLESPDERPDAG